MEGFSTHKIIPHHVHKMPFTLKTKRRLLHPSGTKFVAGGSDLWVRVLFETGEEPRKPPKGHHGPIRCSKIRARWHTKCIRIRGMNEDGVEQMNDL
jgi:hypothetical protein